MSVRKLSPAANLLRNSRLFSLPPPLPRPAPELTSTADNSSETATLPYPIYAAIQTTESSLSRGDWGLKRPLPLKSTTKTSTPTLYIENVDSIDHITDFGSALNHTQTLQKWQEMNLSLSLPSQEDQAPQINAFDAKYDNTESRPGTTNERWKFKGPWIAGKTNGEFADYLNKNVRRSKLGFRQFVRERYEHLLANDRRQDIRESGQDMTTTAEESVSVSEEMIDEYIRGLRNNPTKLNSLIEDFFDLPRQMEPPTALRFPPPLSTKGPPITHPSAGLSYLRTNAHVFNHPVHGPQTQHAPVEARVLRPQTTAARKNLSAMLGVGGIASIDSRLAFTRASEDPGATDFDPDVSGGGKIWVQPTTASINSRGHINLSTQRPPIGAKAALGDKAMGRDDKRQAEAANSAVQGGIAPSMRIQGRDNSRARSKGQYGLENFENVAKAPVVEPFKGNLITKLGGALRQDQTR